MKTPYKGLFFKLTEAKEIKMRKKCLSVLKLVNTAKDVSQIFGRSF